MRLSARNSSLTRQADPSETGSLHSRETINCSGRGKADEELIFDLGGNVAEWVLLPDGKGEAIGGSADQAADARSMHAPNTAYIGFRVVRGAAKEAAKP